MARIRPESPQVYCHLARAHALKADRKGALNALEKAVGPGFDGVAELESSPDFEAVRSDPAFQKMLEVLRKRPGEGSRVELRLFQV